MPALEDDNDVAPPPGEPATVGSLLRRLRENRGLTQEAVSLETRIPVISIRKIEDNRFVELPGEVFVRGFLRAYARAVGADPVRVMAVYDEQRGPAEPSKASGWPGLFLIQRPRRLGLFVAVVLFLAVLGLLLAFVFRGYGQEDTGPARATGGGRPDAGAADAVDAS
jgi:cytoskeletal protein RodZ